MIIIIDSCQSGSFIDVLIDEKRMIITSTDQDQEALFSKEGNESFSHYFWNEIKSNKYLDTAFFMAKNFVKKSQTACIEADGLTQSYKEDNIAANDICLRIDNNCQKDEGPPCNTTEPDAFEPDDTYQQAKMIITDYTQCHNLYYENNNPDEDWIIVFAPDKPKKLQLLNPGKNCDPLIKLYDFSHPESEPITLDDGLTGENEIHEIQGHYYAKISNYNTKLSENTSYLLKISKTTGTGNGSVYGCVINASDPHWKEGCDCQSCGTPIDNVIITIKGAKTYTPVYKKNDIAGMYYISGLDVGTYEITAIAHGYIKFSESIEIKQYNLTQKDIVFKSITCDLNGDNSVDLKDVIIDLTIIAGISSDNVRDDYKTSGADIDNNHTIGLAEVIYLIQKLTK
ncbi:MAG: hypothetical protein OMM_04736 [Candidatus Magnetoglobus multicellularis str. Araruama]|uniref:Dockerin domain-containing protein n=1 Tax=Candidatus Magnetoglobus multicellularis str. Araruama TaxID=890399 RepID=A0A1V1NZZ9_9BACT|nr:MAG: hypothetical protein OMM_04736 [Candidatus Magnetoglobus multicellularis str. Araruama]